MCRDALPRGTHCARGFGRHGKGRNALPATRWRRRAAGDRGRLPAHWSRGPRVPPRLPSIPPCHGAPGRATRPGSSDPCALDHACCTCATARLAAPCGAMSPASSAALARPGSSTQCNEPSAWKRAIWSVRSVAARSSEIGWRLEIYFAFLESPRSP